MLETLTDFYKATSIIDLIYLVITIWSLISSYKKGFILSILSMAKWLLAYVITLIIFPRVKPHVKDIIDNEYVLDILLGVSIFVIIMFTILLVNKGIKRTVKYTGMGKIDVFFGFLLRDVSKNKYWKDLQLVLRSRIVDKCCKKC